MPALSVLYPLRAGCKTLSVLGTLLFLAGSVLLSAHAGSLEATPLKEGNKDTTSGSKTLPVLTPAQLKHFHMEEGARKARPYLLVDFYSDFCSTCMQAEPFLRAIHKKMATKLHGERVNVQREEELSSQYRTEGTPTYILFDKSGNPVYRMHRFISMTVLYTQLQRYTGGLPSLNLAPQLLPQTFAPTYYLVAIHPKDCKPCETQMPYLNAMSFAKSEPPSLTVVTWDPAEPDVAKALKDHHWPKSQGYLLITPERQELLKVTGNINPQELWKNISLLMDNGL